MKTKEILNRMPAERRAKIAKRASTITRDQARDALARGSNRQSDAIRQPEAIDSDPVKARAAYRRNSLAASLWPYVSPDDFELSRVEFLSMVVGRIVDDIKDAEVDNAEVGRVGYKYQDEDEGEV
jgi:hypothetical protein